MNYTDIINSKFAEPAVIMTYRDGLVRIVDVNEAFISEMWMTFCSIFNRIEINSCA